MESPAPDAPADANPSAPGRLVLIGTGHVFQIREAVRDAIRALGPDVVFVELDRGRLQALLHRERTGEAPAAKGFVQGRLQRFQEGVAGLYGAEVGGEMVAAVEGARDVGAQVMLVDRPGEQTVRRAMSELTFKEKMRAIGQVGQAWVRGLLPKKRSDKDAMEAEIRRYQEDPNAAIGQLKQQFPTVYRVVIDERDEHMVQGIRRGLMGRRLGVAVVGDGHVEGMLRRLQDIEVTTYRLSDVREGRLPKPEGLEATGDAEDVRFGFDVEL